jgi:hypothetical protein
MSLRKVCK